MQYIDLGQTGLRVSRICFGSWAFGGDWGGQDAEDAKAAVRRALELGIDFFDTAQAYGWGASERLLAEALRDEIARRRDRLVLATKGGLRKEGGGLRRDASPGWLRRGLEESLRNLGTDYIDVYQVHWPDPEVPLAETAGELDAFVKEGKVRFAGVSNFEAAQMEEMGKTRPVDTLQPPYHLFRRDVEEETLPYCREHGIGVLVYSPLAHGLLTGKYSPGHVFPEGDWRRRSPLFQGGTFRRNLEIVRRLEAFARERGLSVAELAVAWTLSHPAVHSAIVGARRPSHIEGSAGAADVTLSEEDRAAIDPITAGAVPVGGPSPEAV